MLDTLAPSRALSKEAHRFMQAFDGGCAVEPLTFTARQAFPAPQT